jgi:type I restriction enzyme S subunit
MGSEGWKKIRLAEFAKLVKKQYQPKIDEELIYIGLEHIEQQSLRINGTGNSKNVISQKYKFSNGDILFGKLRPYFRKVFRPKFDGVCSTDIWVVNAKNGFDQSFLFYFLANQNFIDACNSGSSGTRMPRADWDHLSETEWKIPPLSTQRRIVDILSALDDKIELNRQTNATLEAIAQAIFKEWFVNFNFPGATGEMVESELGMIPKGWKAGAIGDILDLFHENVTPYRTPNVDFFHYSIPAFDNGRTPSIETGGSILSNKFKVKSNSILVSKLNPRIPRVWPVNNVDELKSICSTEFQVLVPKKRYFYAFGVNLFSQQSIQDTMKSRASGTSGSHQRINPQDILNIELIIPDDGIMHLYNDIASDNYQKLISAQYESITLSKIRDTLLPKLMSGEIEI